MAFFNVPLVPELTARRAGGRFDRSMLKAGMTEEDVARFRREIVDYGALRHALGWYRALPLSGRGGTDFEVTVPTTMVWSTRDIAIARRAPPITGMLRSRPSSAVLSGAFLSKARCTSQSAIPAA